MDNWRQTFAKRLKQARKENNLSQKDLALELGLSDKSISAYEKARVLPPTYLLPKFAQKLNRTISYFFGDDTAISEIRQNIIQLQLQLEDLTKTLTGLADTVQKIEKETPSEK